jgi:enediyne biosynthesis protein E4
MRPETVRAKMWRWGAYGLVGAGLLVVLLGDLRPAPAIAEQAGESWFEEVGERAGIKHKHISRSFKNPYAHIMQGYTALGAAVAGGDYNGDGFEDVFVTTSEENGKNRLYRNNGDFTFTEVGEAAGVANGNDEHNASGDALWFDYNNDGRLDLLVVRFGHSQLFENLGNGTFKDVTAQAGLGKQYLNSIVAIAFDYDRDGYVDILLGNYFQPVNLFNPQTPHFFPESFETANNGGGVTLYHNNGDGTFTDVTDKAGVRFSGWALDLGHADADHDGDDDLYVAVDFGTDRFFVNNGDGTFTDMTEKAIGIDTKKGMNADWGDFNNDGLFDVYVTNITDEYMREGNFLWKNNGDGTFADVARETGTYDTGWGWAGKFFDYDNDGWQDLYVVNGWVSQGPENYVVDIFQLLTSPNVDLSDARNWPPMGNKTLSGYQEKCLFHNQGGTLFTNEAARHGLNSKLDGRGIAVADFDNDGRLDLLVSNANARPLLYRNIQPTGNHWVQFALKGTRSNTFAVGARLWVTSGGQTQVGFVNGGNGFASQSSLRVHFGLGQATQIERLEVAWPSGARQTFVNLQPNRIYAIVEDQAEIQPFQPKATKVLSETGAMHRSDGHTQAGAVQLQ